MGVIRSDTVDEVHQMFNSHTHIKHGEIYLIRVHFLSLHVACSCWMICLQNGDTFKASSAAHLLQHSFITEHFTREGTARIVCPAINAYSAHVGPLPFFQHSLILQLFGFTMCHMLSLADVGIY